MFNFVIGDDLKATFGKNSSATERVIGRASLILTVATLGEGKVVTSGLKGAGKLDGKVFAKDVAETVVVRETATAVGSKAAAGVGRTAGKEATSEASAGAKSFLSKPTAGDNVGSKLSSEGMGEIPKRNYEPSPKHDPQSGWGSPNPIPDAKTGQEPLGVAYSPLKDKQLYKIYE
ncbi:hypothetical protein [Paenibacillus sonchi]|uniref:hypothetical protein n=1 Tax=Paenibacillus sonchi TaxID=373687 RepID=UPI001E34B0CF|nr:hypothetical protein [Paenibacillus sonchi]MCE3199838.1 hypothetical protein [Paenibacillus sonchi]